LLKVTFIDVAKGDAALVEFPNNKTMLIDGGGFRGEGFDVGKAVIAPVLYRLGIKKIDYVVASHPHKDHIGGLAYILEKFNVDELWMNSEISSSMAYKKMIKISAEKGILIKTCSSNSPSVLINGVQIDIISPCLNEQPNTTERNFETNNNSLVMKITFRKTSFLFTGDILEERERNLVYGRKLLQSTVLKVPHHGREGSSSRNFIRRVLPEVAVISCRSAGDRNSPCRRVLDEYREAGIKIYRTDINGAITIETDGETYSIKTNQAGKKAQNLLIEQNKNRD
jgi:competence protein ComEC